MYAERKGEGNRAQEGLIWAHWSPGPVAGYNLANFEARCPVFLTPTFFLGSSGVNWSS